MDALDHLISKCLALVDGPDPGGAVGEAVRRVDLDAVNEAIVARPGPWFFHADHRLTLFATQAHPGTGSAPHDHGLWAVIACLEGREGSRRYELHDDGLVQTGQGRLDRGQAHLVPSDAIHAVFNCWTEPNLVLHVYGGDFLSTAKNVWDPISGNRSVLGLSEPLAPFDGPR